MFALPASKGALKLIDALIVAVPFSLMVTPSQMLCQLLDL